MIAANDPLLHEIDLPWKATCYPLGFRLNLATNSREVIEAADEAWGAYTQDFARQPLEVKLIVQPGGTLAESSPLFRGQGDLFSIVYDRHNFGVYDVHSMTGYCFVSDQTAANHLFLRLHFLEATVYSMLAQRHAVPMHAAAVMRGGSGFLLCGPSGAGKSTLAYACGRAGWTFVSDDATWLAADVEDRIAIGKPRYVRFREDAPRLFPELRCYAAEQKPNGKITIEVSTSDFPQVHTTTRCRLDHLVALDRRPLGEGRPPRVFSISAGEVVDRMLADAPSYGERVRELYKRTLRRLADTAAWRLQYESLEQALALLSEIEST